MDRTAEHDPGRGPGHDPGRDPFHDALTAPIGRRRALAVIGSSVAGLVVLEACGAEATPAPRGWVVADVDPATLQLDVPVPVRFAGDVAGANVSGSAWLVRRAADELVAFDPSCPHAHCAYEWTDEATFSCLCHDAFFDLDGNVLSGPPRHPLGEYRVREIDGRVELYLPADFATPRPTA
jgi:nitrite reductase/ring-hydroxylating ferredoxin subunit